MGGRGLSFTEQTPCGQGGSRLLADSCLAASSTGPFTWRESTALDRRVDEGCKALPLGPSLGLSLSLSAPPSASD